MHWMNGWFLGMHALWWVFWIVIVVVLFSFAPPVPRGRAGGSPLETLQQRYARGEIGTAEYEERKSRLLQDGPAA